VGQARATQKGWLTPNETAGGATLCLFCALIIGIYLSKSTGGLDMFMLFVTITSIFNAVCYTGGEEIFVNGISTTPCFIELTLYFLVNEP
jgi:1,4-dihydroxy-2-naphthoate octaprenyltransferase